MPEDRAGVTHYHIPSDSEKEEWDDDKEWEVESIRGEHTNTRGETRYQVVWWNWKREDGTNWTWEYEDGTAINDIRDMQNRWNNAQLAEYRNRSRDPFIPPFHTYILPEEECQEVSTKKGKKPKRKQQHRHLFTELTDQARMMAVDYREEPQHETSTSVASAAAQLRQARAQMELALDRRGLTMEGAVAERLFGLGPAPQAGNLLPAQSNLPLAEDLAALSIDEPAVKVEQPPSPKISHVQIAEPERSINQPQLRTNSDALSASTSTNAPYSKSQTARKRPTRSLPKRIKNKRRTLQDTWAKIILKTGAAPITFANEINDDEIPVLDPVQFRYLESEYIYESVPSPEKEFLTYCGCKSCSASVCQCQEDSEIYKDDKGAKRSFVYDRNGLFTFPDTITGYIIECNEFCACDERCRSRVAQHPRIVPIEIFRTKSCGWGVRSPEPIKRGTVLGVYTGEIIKRKYANTRDQAYIFDLDFMDAPSDAGRYSVDASKCGNWSRFVNHSCDPNCSLYSVVWDTSPALHQPKLAFVAAKDIPTREELTIDYCPQARKGKGRSTGTPGTPDCRCEGETCRGYIYG